MSTPGDPSPDTPTEPPPREENAESKPGWRERVGNLLRACWQGVKRIARACWEWAKRSVAAGWGRFKEQVGACWICSKKFSRDVCRPLSFLVFVFLLSDFVYKRAFRFFGATVAVAVLAVLAQYIPLIKGSYSTRTAVFLPLIIGGAILAFGLVLRLITNLCLSHLTNVAQAADLDLMEDYRKSEQQQQGHLESLWERVFRHDWAVGSAQSRLRPDPDEAPPCVCSDEGAENDPLGLGHFQFMRRARFALERAQSQPDQRYHLGIDLRFLEDWYNGGYFDREDRKLTEQFQASITLGKVKEAAGYGTWHALADLPMGLSQKYWFAYLTHTIGIQVGAGVTCLNRNYNTDYFNAQAIFWPGQEDSRWLLEQFGKDVQKNEDKDGREDLLCCRKQILVRVFGKEEEDVERVLHRVMFPGFWFATRLRVCYDPEYIEGSLGYDPVGDIEAEGVEEEQIELFRTMASRVAADRRALEEYLGERNEFLLADANAEAFRAVRIAMHVNRQGLQKQVRKYAGTRGRRARDMFSQNAAAVIKDVLEEKEEYTTRLVALRVHHELARLHHDSYVDLVRQLRESVGLAGASPSQPGQP